MLAFTAKLLNSWTYRWLSSEAHWGSMSVPLNYSASLHLPLHFTHGTYCGHCKKAFRVYECVKKKLKFIYCVKTNTYFFIFFLMIIRSLQFLFIPIRCLGIATQQHKQPGPTEHTLLCYVLSTPIPPHKHTCHIPWSHKIYFCPNLSSNITTPTLQPGTSPGTRHHLRLCQRIRVG